MTKVKNITVHNFKAISDQQIDLNGCSAIITAGNNKGKTTLLRGMADRFQGLKPNEIVKRGEEKGVTTMELTDGSVIQWKFTEKSESFKFTTKDEIVQTTGVLSSIGKMYFGDRFDIDKFITKSSKEQVKEVQKLTGVDLTELDKQQKETFDLRTDANKELKRLHNLNIKEPLELDAPDIESIKAEKLKLQKENIKLKADWIVQNEKHQEEAINFNQIQDSIIANTKEVLIAIEDLKKYKGSSVGSFIDFISLEKFYNDMPISKNKKEVTTLVEPEYHSFAEIDKRLEDAYTDKAEFDNYTTDLEKYNEWVKSEEIAINEVARLNSELEEITEKKLEKIKEANLPDEFEMTDDGILYKGFSLDNSQISTSAKYIAALKLGSLVLGRIRTMHFDCSYLDKNSLQDILDWADDNDLQLLIEKPDFEAGDIQYNIVEKLS